MPDRRILVVDDDHDVSKVLAEILLAAGYSAEHVETAEAARAKLIEGGFIGAVIDCVMPRHRADDLMALAQNSGVAVVLMSGDERAIAALKECGLRYLQKPFRMRELLQSVEAALSENQALRRAHR